MMQSQSPSFGDAWALLRTLTRSGWRSSEFWLSLLGAVVPWLLMTIEPAVNKWAAGAGVLGSLVLAVYTWARLKFKRETLKEWLRPVPPPPVPLPDYQPGDTTAAGNEVAAGPGSAAAEEARRAAGAELMAAAAEARRIPPERLGGR